MKLTVFLLVIAISVSNGTPLSTILYRILTDSSLAELRANSTEAIAEAENYLQIFEAQGNFTQF